MQRQGCVPCCCYDLRPSEIMVKDGRVSSHAIGGCSISAHTDSDVIVCRKHQPQKFKIKKAFGEASAVIVGGCAMTDSDR